VTECLGFPWLELAGLPAECRYRGDGFRPAVDGEAGLELERPRRLEIPERFAPWSVAAAVPALDAFP
jgi:hypothetical protein